MSSATISIPTHGHTHEGRRGGQGQGQAGGGLGGGGGGGPAAGDGTSSSRDQVIPSEHFYGEYHGHRVGHIAIAQRELRRMGKKRLIWLAGDSTLDNKFWLLGGARSRVPAVNGYEKFLSPPSSVPDVAYWVNAALAHRGGGGVACVNAACEESTLGARAAGKRLLPQDCAIRDGLGEDDVLVTSVGGNDIALAPSLMTILSIIPLVTVCSDESIRSGTAWGLGHFIRLFRDATQGYIEAMVAKQRPRRVCVCMLYYLDEQAGGSWADTTLRLLGYNKNPARLKLLIRTCFERATSEVAVEGVEVVPVPLFEALDGSRTGDYVQRVEPSAEGGRRLAEVLVEGALGSKYCKPREGGQL